MPINAQYHDTHRKKVWQYATTALIGSLLLAAPYTALAEPAEEKIEPSARQLEAMQRLTPADFERTATVRDDDLESIVTITTANGYRSNGRFTDRVRSDNFLRAFINRRTGAVRYQVYQEVSYNFEWRNFSMVNYATPDGPVTADLTDIAHDVVACFQAMCSYKDALGFDVPGRVIEMVAAQYVAGNSPFWRFRFKARNGVDWEDRMLPAEAAGLLARVRAWRAQRNLGQP